MSQLMQDIYQYYIEMAQQAQEDGNTVLQAHYEKQMEAFSNKIK